MLEWTREHDIILCREILATNPFLAKKATTDQGSTLGSGGKCFKQHISQPKFELNKGSVRDH